MKAFRILFTGIVQGVGFRPFVYRIAVESGVKGYVRNMGGSEVEVKVEGDEKSIARFMSMFFSKLPPPARLERVVVEECDTFPDDGFKIEKSSSLISEAGEIPPDLAVCDDCMEEVIGESRRHNYPFNSCAYCGPRFSMLYSLPYDRENTSMREFPMCNSCIKEYNDPKNERRFDAQGISCRECGPSVFLQDITGLPIETQDPILTASRLVKEGYIVALKGVGGFHIAADPFNDDVLRKLRERKRRPQQPFALMSIPEKVKELAYVSEIEESILNSPERPIVLLKEKGREISSLVSPGLDKQGFFLFYTPLHYLFLRELGVSVMTSANIHGMPMCTDVECVRRNLNHVVDYVLDHNRKIVHRVDDSVITVSAGRAILLRRSRGFAPTWIRIKRRTSPTVSVGAELQNAGAVAFDDKVILTPYVGDTNEIENLEYLEKEIRFLLNTYSLKPTRVIADLNPSYQSLRLARKLSQEFSCDLVQVQHHFAHGLSVAAETGDIKGVIIALDGIGYGEDGNGWGGEVLSFNGGKFKREYHLRNVSYAGGDVNAKMPDRMLALFLSVFLSWDEIGKITTLNEKELRMLQIQSKSPLMTSSTGRFLDAFASLLDVCHERTYEGEPAMKLEALATKGKLLDFHFPIKGREIDTIEAFKWALGDHRREDVARTILYRLGEALAEVAMSLSPNKILVSGGATVNQFILKGIVDNSKVEVITPRKVPAGDGGIALGQSYYSSLEE
ncbi:carbamoyltransferase HypF [Sulfuracidifex metallicus]|uniref:carbamoyltransferase HypF n=1 Tax=Sulfuracidifex metallicus TaxID=47303 RepID=UPI0023F21CE9|nr:carbamoyltransferase HypF [Sulfuracidifex metallicus]